MITLLTDSPEEAAGFIRRGELAAFPTETVYGLGADAFNAAAVQAIFSAKGRPSDNPLIVHVARREDIEALAEEVPEAARRLAVRFTPGPLTLILPRRSSVPDAVTAGLSTVGVRVPRHPVAHAFLKACGTPVAAPSANRSGRPSPTTWEAVREDLGGRIPCLLRGDRTEMGLESTVVDCTRAPLTVLRAGALPLEALRTVCPDVQTADHTEKAEPVPRSPGTRYRHYAPRAAVHLARRPGDALPGPRHAYIGLEHPADPDAFGQVRVCADTADYARELFHFFRQSDAAGCTRIYCQIVPRRGLGRALMDRIERAAAR